MLDKVKIVCAISAIPVAITNLVSYLYHSYTALCALIISGIAVVLFCSLYRWNKKTNPQDKGFKNPFFIFMCIFSFVFLLSGSVMVMGGMTQEQHRKIQTWTWEDADSVRILENRVLELPGAESLIELGLFYENKAIEELNMSWIKLARERFLQAALKYSSPEAYGKLGKYDEFGLDGTVNNRSALENYINGLYLSDYSDTFYDQSIYDLQKKCGILLPDSVLLKLSERETLRSRESITEESLLKYIRAHSPYNFVTISLKGNIKSMTLNAHTAIFSNSYSIDRKELDVIGTISINLSQYTQLLSGENRIIEKALLQRAYGNFFYILCAELANQIESTKQLF